MVSCDANFFKIFNYLLNILNPLTAESFEPSLKTHAAHAIEHWKVCFKSFMYYYFINYWYISSLKRNIQYKTMLSYLSWTIKRHQAHITTLIKISFYNKGLNKQSYCQTFKYKIIDINYNNITKQMYELNINSLIKKI